MGLLDFLKPKDDPKKLLLDSIAYNAELIQSGEGKSREDSEYLAICLLIDDLRKRPNGQAGYKTVMDILQTDYPHQLNDVITYVAWSSGKIVLKPEFEAEMRKRHAK
jgi:hypothetical protein